ncbi:hypothetical protein SYNPS1DRAFT_31272, partial [Syncephalis pseudoplumigaleata]
MISNNPLGDTAVHHTASKAAKKKKKRKGKKQGSSQAEADDSSIVSPTTDAPLMVDEQQQQQQQVIEEKTEEPEPTAEEEKETMEEESAEAAAEEAVSLSSNTVAVEAVSDVMTTAVTTLTTETVVTETVAISTVTTDETIAWAAAGPQASANPATTDIAAPWDEPVAEMEAATAPVSSASVAEQVDVPADQPSMESNDEGAPSTDMLFAGPATDTATPFVADSASVFDDLFAASTDTPSKHVPSVQELRVDTTANVDTPSGADDDAGDASLPDVATPRVAPVSSMPTNTDAAATAPAHSDALFATTTGANDDDVSQLFSGQGADLFDALGTDSADTKAQAQTATMPPPASSTQQDDIWAALSREYDEDTYDMVDSYPATTDTTPANVPVSTATSTTPSYPGYAAPQTAAAAATSTATTTTTNAAYNYYSGTTTANNYYAQPASSYAYGAYPGYAQPAAPAAPPAATTTDDASFAYDGPPEIYTKKKTRPSAAAAVAPPVTSYYTGQYANPPVPSAYPSAAGPSTTAATTGPPEDFAYDGPPMDFFKKPASTAHRSSH